MGRRKLGLEITEAARDRFQAHCEERGLKQWAAATAAFRLFELAPLEIRDLAIKGDDRALREWFEAVRALQLAQAAEQALQRAAGSQKPTRASRAQKAGGKARSA